MQLVKKHNFVINEAKKISLQNFEKSMQKVR